MKSTHRMQVFRYYPDKLYGFVRDVNGDEFFFHLSAFKPGDKVDDVRCVGCPGSPRCRVDDPPPQPILGEAVDVVGDPTPTGRGAPRAESVTRLLTPRRRTGVVESFIPERRYGFVRGDDGQDYHLHGSEVLDGQLPLPGNRVVFYPGIRNARPRACYVKVCR